MMQNYMVNLICGLIVMITLIIQLKEFSKKYQWIAYYEILAKLVDKFPDVQYSKETMG